jgi:hypothetical protein
MGREDEFRQEEHRNKVRLDESGAEMSDDMDTQTMLRGKRTGTQAGGRARHRRHLRSKRGRAGKRRGS